MQPDTIPTLDGTPNPDALVATEAGAQLSTHHRGHEPFGERFRRAKLREQMFGDAGSQLRIGRYQVMDKLGTGAMGVVYLAVDDELERNVAIKLLKTEEEIGRERMLREAKALAKLSHPNVVTVHEVGTHEGQVYVAMEFVDGVTMREWLAGAPHPSSVLEVFCQAARGLQAAHDARIVHRDFKPDNVLVGKDGRVRVLDFGLARPPGASLASEVADPNEVTDLAKPTLTRTGMFAGTPAYMAPEQFAGLPVDARTDQFAFCVALHEALHGERPFQGDSLAELATRVIEGESMTSTSRGVSPTVDAVIRRGIAGDPTKRFPSMNALVLALGRNGAPTPAWVKWGIGALAGALVIFFLAGIAAYVLFASTERLVVSSGDTDFPPETLAEPDVEEALRAARPLDARTSPDLVNPFVSDAKKEADAIEAANAGADAGAAKFRRGDYASAIGSYGHALETASTLDWTHRWPLFRGLAEAAEKRYEQTKDGADLKRLAAIHTQMVDELQAHPMTPDADLEVLKPRTVELLKEAHEVPPVSSADPSFVRLTVIAALTIPVWDSGRIIGATNTPMFIPVGEATELRVPLEGYTDGTVTFDGSKDYDAYLLLSRLGKR